MITELLLALTIYLEAEGESFKGKQAVANVLYNRSNKTIEGMTTVALQTKQFSCWNDNNYVLKRLACLNGKQFAFSCLALLKCKEDITGGATHYTTIKTKRVWMKSMRRTVIIGKHKFMKERKSK